MLVRWRRPSWFTLDPIKLGAWLLAAATGLAAGCGSNQTPKPDQSQVVYEADWATPILGADKTDQYRTRRYLSDQELAEVEKILREIAAEWHVTEIPSTSPGHRRWVDMDDAVRLACENSDVATTSKKTIDGGMEYQLLNMVGLPGILVVTRTYDERVYDAQCQIGLFPDLPSNQANADRLLKELRTSMDTLAAERRRFVQREAAQAETFEQEYKSQE